MFSRAEEIAVFIPIVALLVIGLVLVAFFYLRSKERQMFIERGFTPESMMETYKQKSDGLLLLKSGIICLFFGLGLGLGITLENSMHYHDAPPLFIFTFTGAGMIVAHYAAQKQLKSAPPENNEPQN